jgi:RNA polymerase sigma-70 factor (ECF subfamily)
MFVRSNLWKTSLSMPENSHIEEEAVLIVRLQAGEIEAFDELFQRYRRRILAYVYGQINDHGKAEDITQECFVKLTAKIETIKPEKGVSAWLYRVARNMAYDFMRHRRFEVLPGDEFIEKEREDNTESDSSAPDEYTMQHEQKQSVEAAMLLLSPKERDVLTLRFYGDLTFREIASVVKRPLGTVLWQTRRSLEKLERILADRSWAT